MKLHSLCFLALLAAAAAAPAGAASLAFNLDAASKFGAAGADAVFSGSLRNTGSSDLFVNSLSVSFNAPAGSYISLDANFFFDNVLGVLLASETWSGDIFELHVASSTPKSRYTGTVHLYGGADSGAGQELASLPFMLLLPEPGSLGLAAAGLLAWGAAAARPRRQAAEGKS